MRNQKSYAHRSECEVVHAGAADAYCDESKNYNTDSHRSDWADGSEYYKPQ